MKKHVILIFSFALFCSALVAQPFVIAFDDEAIGDTPDKYINAYASQVKTNLTNKNRVKLHTSDMEIAPQYVLSTYPEINRKADVGEPVFIDSTATIQVPYSFLSRASARISLKSIETSEILFSDLVDASKSGKLVKNFKYLDYKYQKGNNRSKNFPALKKKIKDDVLKTVFKEMLESATKQTQELANLTALQVRVSFPYQLEVNPYEEDGKSKTVRIEGGADYDFQKYAKVIVYSKSQITRGDHTITRLTPICTANINEAFPDYAVARLIFGKKRYKKALEKGDPIFANEGPTPLSLEVIEATGPSIAVGAIQMPGTYADTYGDALTQQLESSIKKRSDFKLLSRSSMQNITNLREAQKDENMLEKQTIDQFKLAGADLLLSAEISDLSETAEGMSGFYTLRLYEVETGSLVGTEKYNFAKAVAPNSPEKTNLVFKSIYLDGYGFLKSVFPLEISLVDIEDSKKGKAKKVIISGDFKGSPWQKLKVFKQKKYEVDGEELVRLIEIGEVSLLEEQGEGVWFAKVKDGEKDIFEAFEADETIVCQQKAGITERTMNMSNKLAKKLGHAQSVE